jgi:hypothetical protein
MNLAHVSETNDTEAKILHAATLNRNCYNSSNPLSNADDAHPDFRAMPICAPTRFDETAPFGSRRPLRQKAHRQAVVVGIGQQFHGYREPAQSHGRRSVRMVDHRAEPLGLRGREGGASKNSRGKPMPRPAAHAEGDDQFIMLPDHYDAVGMVRLDGRLAFEHNRAALP